MALCVSKRGLDKCPGPLRRVSLFTCYCIHVLQWLLCAPLTCAETITSSCKDNSLNIQRFNIWSEKAASSSSGEQQKLNNLDYVGYMLGAQLFRLTLVSAPRIPLARSLSLLKGKSQVWPGFPGVPSASCPP